MPVLRIISNSRYAKRLEIGGTWTVFDVFSGRTAIVVNCKTTGMRVSDAEELVSILNGIHPAEDSGTVH